jgi:alpha/beta superfamily hydrolase
VQSQHAQIQSFFLKGTAGHLEALLNVGSPEANYAGVVCHPHPMFGGTLHNKVVFHAMKALHSFGFPVLRFNFRGTGLSHGKHDKGIGEVDDVHAALDWMDHEFHLPLILVGFSFGAAVGLRAACPDSRVEAVAGLGLPVVAPDRDYSFDFLQLCPKPKLFLSGGFDQYSPTRQLKALVETLPEPKRLVTIDGADHFFEGRLPQMREALEAWLREMLAK